MWFVIRFRVTVSSQFLKEERAGWYSNSPMSLATASNLYCATSSASCSFNPCFRPKAMMSRVGAVELAPTGLVLPILEPADQAGAVTMVSGLLSRTNTSSKAQNRRPGLSKILLIRYFPRIAWAGANKVARDKASARCSAHRF